VLNVEAQKDNITLQEKADQILEWIDKPFDDRPQLITSMFRQPLTR
jgi:hypothetical protein